MKILGVSSNYHDACSALVVDGEVISAATEERFSLIKHDPSFPFQSSKFCVEEAGLSFDDLDFIAYHEDPNVKFTRTISSSFARYPFSLKTYLKSMHEAITSGLRIKHTLSSHFEIEPRKILYVPHHMSHAAHSFYASPFNEAAVLTIDAVGEWTCSGLFRGDGANIEPIDAIFFPHSLGIIYSTFTAFLGFKANDGECSTMALAAFGNPIYAEQVRDIIRIQDNGSYEINISYFDFGSEEKVPVTQKFINIFGEPRPYRNKLPFSCLSEQQENVTVEDQRYADIAASIQLVLEEAVVALVAYAKEKTGSANLCFSGGVALNAVANSKILNSGHFKDVFIPPDPGDGGGAMGAALYSAVTISGTRNKDFVLHPYFGKAYDELNVIEMLEVMDIERIRQFSRANGKFNLDISKSNNESELISHVASSVKKGKVVGWMQGKFENGPRALGNRSILVDPSNIEVANKLSKTIKHRASFRPYAVSLTDTHSERILKTHAHSRPAKWMQTSAPIHAEVQSKIRAAIHIDKTTRPQVCTESDNPKFYKLIKEFGKQTGLECILNTSFNESGFPLVAGPTEALMMFLRTEMDILVLNNTIIERKNNG
ncbi:MAG: hypothetical protein H6625_05710 [Bdellovibrionaceae bacterium]|nr:hypothetical protein [Pseudobdellovibrionaceae bacterium]